MLETVLILKMDSHFHGNDRLLKKQTLSVSHKTGEACPIFMGMTAAAISIFMAMTDP
jgi:hypothetical protein